MVNVIGPWDFVDIRASLTLGRPIENEPPRKPDFACPEYEAEKEKRGAKREKPQSAKGLHSKGLHSKWVKEEGSLVMTWERS